MQLCPTPENRLPPHITCLEVLSKGGLKLRAAFAIPPQPRGTVLVLGGRGDYMERYFETMQDILRRGYAVASFDWRGQGGSGRLHANHLRGFIRDFADYDADIDAVYSRVLVAHCPKPYYGLAHSTGGHLLLRALRGRKWLERAVITAPLLGFHLGAWPVPIVKTLTLGAKLTRTDWAYLPGFSKLPLKRHQFDANSLTSDRKRWDRDMTTLDLHPSLAIGGPTYGWLRAAMKSNAELLDWPKGRGPSCPTLIVMAGLDQVVNNDATRAFLARAPGFSSLTIADSKHEILNESTPVRERFFAAFDAFIAG